MKSFGVGTQLVQWAVGFKMKSDFPPESKCVYRKQLL